MPAPGASQQSEKKINMERFASAVAITGWNPLTSPYWKSVPIARLRDMLIAVFLSSSAIGFVLELITLSLRRRASGPWPIGGTLGAVLFGVATVVFLLVKIGRVEPVRGRFLQFLLIGTPVFWFFRSETGIRIGAYGLEKPPQLSEKALATSVLIDSQAIVLCIFAGYQMFLRFINTEGSASCALRPIWRRRTRYSTPWDRR